MVRYPAAMIFCFVVGASYSQSTHLIDSLEANLEKYSSDEKAVALFTLVSYYQRSDQEKTRKFRLLSQRFLQDIHPKAQTYARMVEGVYYSGVGTLDSAEYWFTLAKGTALNSNDPITMASICSGLGKTLISAGKAKEAVSNLLEGLRLVDQDHDQEFAMKIRINLTWAYLELKRYRDGVNLGRQSLMKMDSSHQWMALYLYNNMAICYGALNQIDSARHFVNLGIEASERNHDYHGLANGHFILGTIYSNAGENEMAIREYELAKPFREKVGNPLFIVSDLYTLSSLYQKTGHYDKGVRTGLEALAVVRQHHLLLKFENTYQVLALNYEGLGDFKQASHYYQLWANAKDSVYQNGNAQAIADMETKYQTEKKEQQIVLQNATIALQEANIQRNYIFIAGLAVVVLLVLVILFLVRSRQLRKQETLRKEYELSLREAFISASIQSQEGERKRFAQDLHDGMGQLISALRFIVLRRDDISPERNEERLSKAEEIMDSMHREIRGVAFNLMPQVLIKSGLVPALQEMAARVSSTGQVKIGVNSYDLSGRLEEIQEISLYRVTQEWINNVLKYANATSIQLQLVAHEREITITLEDDGEGFDKRVLGDSPGNGWKNILSRLYLIKAAAEIDTQPGRRGTTFIVTVPLVRQ